MGQVHGRYNKKYPDKKMTTIETLTRTFDDERVTTMLIVAKHHITTKKIATQLEFAQKEMWMSSGKSAIDVFNLLKLSATTHGFSTDPLFNTWVLYLNFIVKNPSNTSTLMTTLETHFSGRPLNRILEATKKFPSMGNTATKLQMRKMQEYISRRESPQNVFMMTGLGDAGDKVLGNPMFSTWMNYVKVFNKDNPKQQESWFLPLRMEYGWLGVERMINKAMQNPSTVKMAKMVEREWVKEWPYKEKTLPKDAFHYLHLDDVGKKTLTSPRFQVWAEYLDAFNSRYPEKKTTMIDDLNVYYYDEDLLRMFNVAKRNPNTEKLGSSLQNALINKWLADKENRQTLNGC